MISFDKLIFGYIVIRIDESDVVRVINRMIKAGINQNVGKDGTLFVPYRLIKRYRSILLDVSYTESDVKGFWGLVLHLLKRHGFICATVVLALVCAVSFNTVWDIRVEGCSDEVASEVIYELDSAGVKIGSCWLGMDKREVENSILLSSDSVAWISINRRGAVAYVSVIERNSHIAPEKPLGYASLVADRDCIIEEITVKVGYPVVRVGDSVRKGQVLISGVIPQSLGGGYCYAEGSVKGRYSSEIEVHAQDKIVEKEYSGTSLYTLGVKILGLKINIFKNYGKMPTNYDIIKENKEFIFLGRKIPLSVEYEIAREYSEKTVEIGYTDMIRSASGELSRILAEDLVAEDLLGIKTDISEADGYSITARLILRAEVTKIKEFEYISEK